MTNLTARLRQAAELVPPSRSMADIGTDHAYLPLALLEEGKIRAAIASDIQGIRRQTVLYGLQLS